MGDDFWNNDFQKPNRMKMGAFQNDIMKLINTYAYETSLVAFENWGSGLSMDGIFVLNG